MFTNPFRKDVFLQGTETLTCYVSVKPQGSLYGCKVIKLSTYRNCFLPFSPGMIKAGVVPFG